MHVTNNFYDKENGIFYRTGGLTREGYGSYFQRLKSSIIISMFLNKTLIIKDVFESEHNYSVSLQVNEVYTHNRVYNGSLCKLNIHDEKKLLDLMCRDMSGTKSSSSILAQFKKNNSCTQITHIKNQKAGEHFVEDYEIFNDCIQPWLSNTFNKMFENKMYVFPWKTAYKCMNVGIHIRWGDLASDDITQLDGRSIQIVDINFVVYNLRETNICFNYYIFVKNPSEKLLSQFLFDHIVVNNNDDLYDIFLYTHMDIYVQGTSSFSVMSSLINPNKIIITNDPHNVKYTFDYKNVSNVYGCNNITYVNKIKSLSTA